MADKPSDFVLAALARHAVGANPAVVVRDAHALARETCRQFGHVFPAAFNPSEPRNPETESPGRALQAPHFATQNGRVVAAARCERCGGSCAPEVAAAEWADATSAPENAEAVARARFGIQFRQRPERRPYAATLQETRFYQIEMRLPFVGALETIDVSGVEAAAHIEEFCRAYLRGIELARDAHAARTPHLEGARTPPDFDWSEDEDE